MPVLTTQQKLDEATLALHNLRLGRAVVSITDQNGEKLTFVAADEGKLASYVDALSNEITPSNTPRYSAIRFIF